MSDIHVNSQRRDPHRGWNSMDTTYVSYLKWHEAGVRIIAFNVAYLMGHARRTRGRSLES